ncbi:HEAT repeat protein [Polystyrenella longa]|uniref:HEAT repeat protein n=1 Tax=Polystyrenella longa TaxID=2528007 RepID=A0A518CNV0_9PLAN|nr:HEAT repeat domain-containing protein [Polystyrenella longa]QDU80901.1 HEAT repeat protein [Polystyrenella longa]
MTSHLETTFNLLASRKTTEASDLLTSAVDVPVGEIQALAVRALLKKHQLPSQLLIIRKWPELHSLAQDAVFEEKHSIRETVKHCLERDKGELQSLALEVAVAISDYTQIPNILNRMESSSGEQLARMTEAMRMLTDQFYEALFRQESEGEGPNLNTESLSYQKKNIIQQIAGTVSRLEQHNEPDLILESLLILGSPTQPDIKEIMSSTDLRLMKRVEWILQHSRHHGVMQFIVDSMNIQNPNIRVIDAIRQRDDSEFISHLLGEYPESLNAIQSDNYQQIKSIRWLASPERELPLILPAQHQSVIRLMMGVRLPVDQQVNIQKWLIHNGGPETRLAATEVLTTLDQRSADNLINESLESEDPNVQAWATSQLRSQSGASSFEKLINRIDSDIPEVQIAARNELRSFDLELMLKIFDSTPLRTVRQAGVLLHKLDPDVYRKLNEKIHDPLRSKRIRTAQAAFALGLHRNISQSLIALLGDEDPMVRRTAVEILGDVPKRNVYDILYQMRTDSSPRVRDAILKALQKLQIAFERIKQSQVQTTASPAEKSKTEIAEPALANSGVQET